MEGSTPSVGANFIMNELIIMNTTTLYIKDSHNRLRLWHITNIDNVIHITYGLEDGEKVTQTEIVDEGKQTRNIPEQVASRIRSRINKQLDRGYTENRESALTGKPTNSLGFAKPMLAHKFADAKSVSFENAFLQRKYDGHRCLITKNAGELVAYSRNGKPIESISHILETINIEEGQTLDGELYSHGHTLQQISSWVKKPQENSLNLQYVLYDIMDDAPYSKRYDAICNLRWNPSYLNSSPVQIAPTIPIKDAVSAYVLMSSYKKEGYEGAILRLDGYGYQDGKRSHGLLKLKQCDDDVFVVVDIVTAREGWAILTCMTENGKEFKVSAPGTFEEKHEIAANPNIYKGRFVRVEYANLTPDGIPFHPIATNFEE